MHLARRFSPPVSNLFQLIRDNDTACASRRAFVKVETEDGRQLFTRRAAYLEEGALCVLPQLPSITVSMHSVHHTDSDGHLEYEDAIQSPVKKHADSLCEL